MEIPLIIRGRKITDYDVIFIRSIIEKNWGQGRTSISRELCRFWNWRQPNGSLKQMACRELLLRLERKGLVKLPPRKNGDNSGARQKRHIQIPIHSKSPIMGSLSEILPLEIRMVRGSGWDFLYEGLIEAYHYLGYCQTVGEHLKYIAFYKDRPLACIGWGAAAWKVACRDKFIGWATTPRRQNLHLIAQNTRFLILPWVKVPYLASHILGKMARILPLDWERIYKHTIVFLETFVDTTRFLGTCYKAANWIKLGFTKGRGKWDIHKQYLVPVKAIFVYPLVKNFREVLNPDD